MGGPPLHPAPNPRTIQQGAGRARGVKNLLYLEARLRGGTRHWALAEGTFVLGRDPLCDIVVDDLSVSRKHLRIVLAGEALELEDLRSSNGLWVDGARVEKVNIAPGQWFSTGSVLFSVRRSVTVSSLDLGGSLRSTPPEKHPDGAARARGGPGVQVSPAPGAGERTPDPEPARPAESSGGLLPTPSPDPSASGGLLRTPVPDALRGSADDRLPWAKQAADAGSGPDGGDPPRTYRALVQQLVLQSPSPDGQSGALLAAVVALSGCKGGAVVLRQAGEWILHSSRGEYLPNWEELPARHCEEAARTSAGPTLIKAGALTLLCAPVRSAGETVGFILLFPAPHGGTPPGLGLLAEAVLAESAAPTAGGRSGAGASARFQGGAGGTAGKGPFQSTAAGFLTASEPGQRLLQEVDRLAVSGLPVMLVGESGTGKELLAHRIHRRSQRAGGPFVPLNCSAFPKDLVEAELFGIYRGVATGVAERVGRFQQASGGTLFLDEVGDLPFPLQPKILRALESGEILPVGGPEYVKVDVRVLSATHLDLRQAIRENLFRQDLLFRLAGAEILVPPLRARPEDILPLARHFAREAAAGLGSRFLGMDLEAAALLLGYTWPGNVRELRHVVARAVALSDGPILQEALLPPEIRRESDRALGDALLSLREDYRTASEAYARLYFTHLLARHGGNLSEAARKAGIGRTTLYTRLQELGLRPPRDEDGEGSGA